MKIVFSLNTDITNVLSPRPDVLDVILQQYFLSIRLAQGIYGHADVVLLTDPIGHRYLDGFCDIRPLTKTPDFLFSEAKIQALEYWKDEKFIHLDGDLFLNNGIYYRKNSRAIVEHNEANIYQSHYAHDVSKLTLAGINQILPYWQPDIEPVNMGILGLFDSFLLQQYIEDYRKAKDYYLSFKGKIQFTSFIDVVLEQYTLACLLRKNNILPEFTDSKNSYTHLHGRQKFYKKNIDWVKERAERQDGYKELMKRIQTYDKTDLEFRYFPDNE